MPDAGADFHRALLARDPSLAPVRAQLAQALLADDDVEGAIAQSSLALAQDDSLVEAWLVRATAHKALCFYEAAARDLERAAALSPGRPTILVNLANSYAELGQLHAAEQCLRRAIALAPRAKEAHASLGSVLVKRGDLTAAEAPCRAALALDPGLVCAHQNLSAILAVTDPAAARAHRDIAYGRQQVFIERAARPTRTVLILSAADAANVPLRYLMPRARTTLIYWYVEYATADQDHALPPHDLVFNAIGDPDLAPALRSPVTRLLREHRRRLLNEPAKVALTRRSNLPCLLADIPDVVVPRVTRRGGMRESRLETLARAAIAFPVLVRPLGSHGGTDLRRVHDARALAELPDVPSYLAAFVDFVSKDGWYRKYRVIFVDGKPYPYHLAIAKDWLVHYWTAGMEEDEARRAEERRFLDNPRAAIGARAMNALNVIGARLGLEYAGIDFAVLPDGRLLVFEANATMLVHPEHDARFVYRNPAVSAIQTAFDAMLARFSRHA